MEHRPVERRTRDEIIRLIESGQGSDIASALYSAAYHDPDWRWAQSQCLLFLDHPDIRVRWAAATCLGDIAVFHHELDIELHSPDSLEQIRQSLKPGDLSDVFRPIQDFPKSHHPVERAPS